MEEVKEHPYVMQCEDAKPLIVETFKFMYDLDIMNPNSGEVNIHDYIHFINVLDIRFLTTFILS